MSTGPKRPSFIRRPVATAPAAGPMHNPNGPPLRSGQTYVSDDTRRQLKLVGWEDGDEIPTGLPAVLAQVQEKYSATKEEVAAVGSKVRLQKSQTVDIANLPPEAREEIRRFMEQAKVISVERQQQAAERAKIEALIPPNAAPSVREAIEKHATKSLVVDDSADFLEEAAPATPPPVEQPVPEPTVKQEPEAETPPRDPVCPQCGYDCRVPFDIKVDPQDVMSHVAAQLDPSPGARFRKAVTLLGGKLTVVYRSLLTKEAEAARLQTRKDVMDGKIIGEAEYYMNLFEYRLAMSVEKLLDQDGTPLAEVPPLAEIENDNPDVSTLVQLVDFMNTSVYANDSLKRNVGRHHRRFERLVEALEAQEADPDFCRGIETQP